MAGHKRKPELEQLLSKPELLYKIGLITSLRDRALIALLYLSGARISEIVGGKKQLFVYDMTKKQSDITKQPRQLLEVKELVYEPLHKEYVEVLPDDLVLLHNVPCLKRRGTIPKRTIPIIPSQDKELWDMFAAYLQTVPEGQPLFKLTRQRAWQIVNKRIGLFNHFLIHERCTHLVEQKGFSDQDLRQFRGWSDSRPASIYSHLNFRAIAAKMR